MRYLFLLLIICHTLYAGWMTWCGRQLGIIASPLNRSEMVKKKTITELTRFEIGDKGKQLIRALEDCTFNDHGYHPFLDRNSLVRTHSEAFMVPQLTDILLRGIKDFKKVEEKDRAKYELTLNDDQKAYIFAIKQNYEGGPSYTANAIDARPIHFHVLIEIGDGVQWAVMRNDLNNFSRDRESVRLRSPQIYPNKILVEEFNKRWELKEPLPDPFVVKPE